MKLFYFFHALEQFKRYWNDLFPRTVLEFPSEITQPGAVLARARAIYLRMSFFFYGNWVIVSSLSHLGLSLIIYIFLERICFIQVYKFICIELIKAFFCGSFQFLCQCFSICIVLSCMCICSPFFLINFSGLTTFFPPKSQLGRNSLGMTLQLETHPAWSSGPPSFLLEVSALHSGLKPLCSFARCVLQ